MLEENGYPFNSKEYSHYLNVYQHSGIGKTVYKYLNRPDTKFKCPDKLRYQFTEDYKIKTSDKCCYKLKKEPAAKWAVENNKSITLTGMRSAEGGIRSNITCTVFDEGNLKKFHPLAPITEDFINWFIQVQNIKLCELYYPPFNFERTGCKGCPYSLDLQNQLDIMSYFLPAERKQCEYIWKPIYEEYRRINYRLNNQPTLFE